MLYFDNAATTYPKPEQVYKEMDRLTRECAVNSGRGSYKKAENASAVINETRKKVSEFMGAENAEDVIFTSSATEAANRVLRGYGFEENMTVYVSPYEHNAVMRTLEALRKEKKFKIKVLETDEKGYLNLDDIEYQFMCDEPDFVCINLASNVTGYVLPAERVADMAKEYGAIVLADAAQAAGNIEINLKETNIDILIFAGHKSMYGLFGVGGFITNSRIFDRDKNITPVIFGGNGEDSLNLELSERDLSGTQERENRLLKYLIKKLEDIDGIHIFQKLETEEEFQNHIAVLSIGFEKYMSDDAGTILDGEYDIAVRTGYHCAPLVHDVIGSKRYGGTVRISMGRFTTKEDVDELVAAVRDMR